MKAWERESRGSVAVIYPLLSCLVPVARRDGRGRQETESGRLVCPLSGKEDRGREGEEVGKAGYQLHIMWRKTRLGGRRDHLFWLFSAITTTTRVCVCVDIWVFELEDRGGEKSSKQVRVITTAATWSPKKYGGSDDDPKYILSSRASREKTGLLHGGPRSDPSAIKKKNLKNSSPIPGPSLSSSPPCQIPVCDL